MPYYLVDHTTRFRYSAPISESVMEVRMRPRDDAGQLCPSFKLQTLPAARIFTYVDFRGNHIHHFDVLPPHQRLELRAKAIVHLTLPDSVTLPNLTVDDWDRLDQDANRDHWAYLQESDFARFSPALRRLAEMLNVNRRRDPATLLHELNGAVYEHFDYKPATTTVDSTIDEVIESGQGVCQDFAHVMVALLRLVGLPARYVSGYLFHRTDGDDRSAADATHAWVEAWLPDAGWVGLDPTNDLLAGNRHIRCAVGRDYADVPPTRGVFKGDATSELTVAVQVKSIPAPPKVDTPPTPSDWAAAPPAEPSHAAAQAQQ